MGGLTVVRTIPRVWGGSKGWGWKELCGETLWAIWSLYNHFFLRNRICLRKNGKNVISFKIFGRDSQVKPIIIEKIIVIITTNNYYVVNNINNLHRSILYEYDLGDCLNPD